MGEAIAAAARTLVGARFRLHGRERATGLDCVGVVACACGRPKAAPSGYALRGGRAEDFAAMLGAAGLARVDDAMPGDVALVEAGASQFHLIVMTHTGFVHADAALRRVVERPGGVPWPVIGYWRMGEA
ncbi:peptidoglycan endopeptidase [Sphingomonas cavernae]|uniref:peptidoglycan endopeptidase n=1 Tax=Sphingomonas cavernae TaxID=2320861 RepID=UPI001EE51E45|nr:peptidoglycan endopeptidase [Sphingomonas cavernae]